MMSESVGQQGVKTLKKVPIYWYATSIFETHDFHIVSWPPESTPWPTRWEPPA